MFPLIVVITEKVYFSAHSSSVSGARKTRCKAWCFLCLGWRCHENLLQDLRQRVTKLWRRSWKHSYCKLLRLFVMCTFNHGSTHFMLIWRSGGPITLYTTLFCWECTSLPCSIKILRVLIFANFADWPRSVNINSRSKKSPQNKTPQKLTLFSQIKNSAFNGLVVYGRDRLLFCFAVVQSFCAVRY